jgi:hypothetical protein
MGHEAGVAGKKGSSVREVSVGVGLAKTVAKERRARTSRNRRGIAG